MENISNDDLSKIGQMLGQDANTMNQVKKMLQNPTAMNKVKRMMGQNIPIEVKSKKCGRNELCPCNSGLKYKKCCDN